MAWLDLKLGHALLSRRSPDENTYPAFWTTAGYTARADSGKTWRRSKLKTRGRASRGTKCGRVVTNGSEWINVVRQKIENRIQGLNIAVRADCSYISAGSRGCSHPRHLGFHPTVTRVECLQLP